MEKEYESEKKEPEMKKGSFLEYCVQEYSLGRDFTEEEKTFLEKNGYSLTQNGK